MWGPYDRTSYDRGGLASTLHLQSLSATYKMAGSMAAELIYLLTLAATYVLQGYRIKSRPGKLLRGSYEMQGGFVRSIGKRLSATYEYVGGLSMLKSFLRTFSATVEFTGSLVKTMYQSLAATVEFKISRLRARNRYGFEFTGNFPDGSEIIIDRDTWTVTLNGANALHLIDGDPPFFVNGSNVLTYSDDEGARTVAIKAIYRGRWL
jgi:hypothetical protein